jgi:hypothetical protein
MHNNKGVGASNIIDLAYQLFAARIWQQQSSWTWKSKSNISKSMSYLQRFLSIRLSV